MRAAVASAYGPPEVIRVKEIPTPEPKDDEVLIRIRAAGISAGDTELRTFHFPAWFWIPLRLYFGVFKPRFKVFGTEFAGVVESVGSKVHAFKPGDRVFGSTGARFGTHAEYLAIGANRTMVHLPEEISFEEAAGIPIGGLNGLHFTRLAKIQKGERVLVYGATGSIGLFILQFAKLMGAHVTAVCTEPNLDFVKNLGADIVLDYKKDDYSNQPKFDVVFEAVGKTSFGKCLKTLKPKGRFVLTNPRTSDLPKAIWVSLFSSKKMVMKLAGEPIEDLVQLADLIKKGPLKSVYDRVYTLDEIHEAHRYVEKRVKLGSVILKP